MENGREWQYLERWAAREFLSIHPQTKVIVTQAIAEDKEESFDKTA